MAGEGHKAAKLRVKQQKVAGVAKVIGVSKLKGKYEPFEAKRQLCNSYDLFVADDRVVPSLPKLIGTHHAVVPICSELKVPESCQQDARILFTRCTYESPAVHTALSLCGVDCILQRNIRPSGCAATCTYCYRYSPCSNALS